MEPGPRQAGQSLVLHRPEKPQLLHNQLDRPTDHDVSQSSDNEKSGNSTANQDATVDIGQPAGKSNTETDPKKKNGGYGYYVV
jgi:hypothetical protein